MKRRQLLKAAAFSPVLATLPALGADDQYVDYTPEVYRAALGSGEPFILDFFATW